MYIQYTLEPPPGKLKHLLCFHPTVSTNPNKQKTKKKRPTWAPEFPNLGHAFQAIVQLPELSMVDILLMEVCKLTPGKDGGRFFFHVFPIFSGEKMSFMHKIHMLHCFQLNVHDGSWKSDHFFEIYGLQFKKTFFNRYLVWKNLVPSTIPAAFLKKIDTHHRPPRLDVLNQVAGR